MYLKNYQVKVQSSSVVSDESQIAPPTFGLVVVHCHRDPEMTWLDDVPSDWKLTVYETCGKNISRGSVSFENRGSEECTGYFQYVLDNYNDLPDINVFLQDDALLPYKGKGRGLWHTPFRTIPALENATLPHISQSRGFLHFGKEDFGRGRNVVFNDSYTGDYEKEVWDDLGLTYTNDTVSKTRPKACFAAHRDRILANSREVYSTLQQKIFSSDKENARKKCCALENSWHVVFGEPAVLPASSTLDQYLQEIGFKDGDLIG